MVQWWRGQDDAYEDCVSSLEGGIAIDVLKSVGKQREMSGEMQYQSAP